MKYRYFSLNRSGGLVKGNTCLPVHYLQVSSKSTREWFKLHCLSFDRLKNHNNSISDLQISTYQLHQVCVGVVLYCNVGHPRCLAHQNTDTEISLISMSWYLWKNQLLTPKLSAWMNRNTGGKPCDCVVTCPFKKTSSLIRKKRKRVVKAFNVERQERGSMADTSVVALGCVLFGQLSGSAWRQQARRLALQEWRLHPASWPLVHFEFSARPECRSHPVTCSRDGAERLASQNCLWVQDAPEPTSIVNVRPAFCTSCRWSQQQAEKHWITWKNTKYRRTVDPLHRNYQTIKQSPSIDTEQKVAPSIVPSDTNRWMNMILNVTSDLWKPPCQPCCWS